MTKLKNAIVFLRNIVNFPPSPLIGDYIHYSTYAYFCQVKHKRINF